ncbi:MAG: hypothetical protein ACXVYB_05370 [Arthrobacter sp.]
MIKRLREALAANRKAGGKKTTPFNAQLLERNREDIYAVLHRMGMMR